MARGKVKAYGNLVYKEPPFCDKQLAVWWDFRTKFIGKNLALKTDEYKHTQDFNAAVYKWADQHKGKVFLVQCDDLMATSSDILLIPSGGKFVSIMVVFLPQNSHSHGAVVLSEWDASELTKTLKLITSKKPNKVRRGKK